jgi:hypothetical protein
VIQSDNACQSACYSATQRRHTFSLALNHADWLMKHFPPLRFLSSLFSLLPFIFLLPVLGARTLPLCRAGWHGLARPRGEAFFLSAFSFLSPPSLLLCVYVVLSTHRTQAPWYSIYNGALYPNSTREGAINTSSPSVSHPERPVEWRMVGGLHLPPASQSILILLILLTLFDSFTGFCPWQPKQQTPSTDASGQERRARPL